VYILRIRSAKKPLGGLTLNF